MSVIPTKEDYLRRHLREVPLFRALLRSVECSLVHSGSPFDGPILDLGSGDGVFASMFEQSTEWIGIDPSFQSAVQAQDRIGHSKLAVGDGCRLPLPNDSIGTVISNSVLEHIPDLDTTLNEVQRVLLPGGRLILTVPTDRFAELLLGSSILRGLGLGKLAKSYGDWFNKHSLHFHTDSIRVWQQRLEERGFTVLRSKEYFTGRTHRIFDMAHYVSLPRLVTYKLTGKWVLFPESWQNQVFYYWLRKYLEEEETKAGAYLFIEARKEQ